MGKLRILDMNDTIEKVELKSNCTLVLMGLQSFCWDAAKCDGSLKVRKRSPYILPSSFRDKGMVNVVKIKPNSLKTTC